MKLTQTALGVGTLALGLLIFGLSFQLSSDAGYAGVGPNFLPLVVGAVLALCGLLQVREALTGGFRDREEPSGAQTGQWGPFVWVSVGILLNALLITRIGFILSCALCFVLAAQGFKRAAGQSGLSASSIGRDVLIGLCIAAPVYWMFSQLLSINLPSLTSTGWL